MTENNQNVNLPKSEDKIQAEIVAYYTNTYCLRHHRPRNVIFSVPNGGHRHKAEAVKMVATGLLAGASDLVLIHYGQVIFVEVKNEKGSQTRDQKEFQSRVSDHGLKYVIVRSLDEFKEMLPLMDSNHHYQNQNLKSCR